MSNNNNNKDDLFGDSSEENQTELTTEQQKAVLDAWNNNLTNEPPDIRTLCEICWGEENIDPRTWKSRLVKDFLATRKLKAKTNNDYIPKPKIILNEEQKIYIVNNCGAMNACEIAKILFNNQRLTNLHLETKAVLEHLKTLPNVVKYSDIQNTEIIDGDYRPPKTLMQAGARVNKYVLNGVGKTDLEKNTKVQSDLKSLIKFCHTHRFMTQMNSFVDLTEKELFESCYIRYVWDKSDLTEEEIDAYINLSIDVVNYTRMQKELGRLTEERDRALDSTDGQRISISIVEMISKLYGEMDNNLKRQNKALENLQGKRSERLNSRIKVNASVINLVEKWRDKQERDRLIKLANDRKKVLKVETERLDTLDNYIAEMYGLNKNNFDLFDNEA